MVLPNKNILIFTLLTFAGTINFVKPAGTDNVPTSSDQTTKAKLEQKIAEMENAVKNLQDALASEQKNTGKLPTQTEATPSFLKTQAQNTYSLLKKAKEKLLSGISTGADALKAESIKLYHKASPEVIKAMQALKTKSVSLYQKASPKVKEALQVLGEKSLSLYQDLSPKIANALKPGKEFVKENKHLLIVYAYATLATISLYYDLKMWFKLTDTYLLVNKNNIPDFCDSRTPFFS
jgi:hypothetical protein